ncbi:MAG: hypothetical protein ABI947_13495 [Chloroflexota bacterium]
MHITNDTEFNLEESQPSYDLPSETQALPAQRAGITIPVELLLYAALLLFALALRLPELGTNPLNDRQAHEALAAFRAVTPRADLQPDETQIIAQNPLMFVANTLLMSAAASTTTATLLPTALLGVLVVGLPLLFRRWLGTGNALIVTVLLAISPVLLLASRSMGGTVWSMALALLGLFCIGRFIESRAAAYAVAATIFLALLVLMAEPAGFVMFLGLLVGLLFAASGNRTGNDTVDTNDETTDNHFTVSMLVRSWPWGRALLSATVVVGLVGTVFLLYPRGLSGIGEVLNQAIRGFVTRPEGQPIAFPLLTSFLYEPVLWVFGLVGLYWTLNSEGNSPADFIRRVLVGWLGISLLAALFYPGARAEHALWFTIPLVGLAALTVERALIPVRDKFWDVPIWGPYLHGVAVVAMLAITGINLVIVARLIMNTAPGTLPTIDQPLRLIFIVPAALLVVITFFLVGSIWGARAAWHGLGIGVLAFLGAYSLGAGWRAAVVNADDPREFWRIHPAARNLNLMETTLITASKRVTSAPYDMQILVLTGEDGPTEDGALAWALHRFQNTEYVKELALTTNAPVIIARQSPEAPKAGAAYVGQDFPVYYIWDRGSLSWDFLSWVYDRTTRVLPQSDGRVIVWVRSDVYGVPPPDQASTPLNVPPVQDLPPAQPPPPGQPVPKQP